MSISRSVIRLLDASRLTHSPKGNLAVNTATTLASTETKICDKSYH